ncbi:hypothetical protein [Gordonia sp. FQ]|uniref:hypothetical protein n=1 Tax=Gordonia sp. FQ TaxID=3446634 RepID=UPI003F8352C7
MKDQYTDVKQDLYGAFVVRGIELADRRGLLAVVIGDTWMSIKSFESLRLRLLDGHAFGSFVHLRDVSNHPDIFGANAAFVLSMANARRRRAPFIRLTPLGSERKERDLHTALLERTQDAGFHLASGEDFAGIPGSPIVYWLSENLRRVFATYDSVGDRFDAIAGISTGDNVRFFRFWHEVSVLRIGGDSEIAPWAPHHKGGASRKWAGNVEHVLQYSESSVKQMTLLPGFRHDGNADYFKPHVGWSALTSIFHPVPIPA